MDPTGTLQTIYRNDIHLTKAQQIRILKWIYNLAASGSICLQRVWYRKRRYNTAISLFCNNLMCGPILLVIKQHYYFLEVFTYSFENIPSFTNWEDTWFIPTTTWKTTILFELLFENHDTHASNRVKTSYNSLPAPPLAFQHPPSRLSDSTVSNNVVQLQVVCPQGKYRNLRR